MLPSACVELKVKDETHGRSVQIAHTAASNIRSGVSAPVRLVQTIKPTWFKFINLVTTFSHPVDVQTGTSSFFSELRC